MIYAFLTAGADVLAATPPGREPPPMLYDASIHRRPGQRGRLAQSRARNLLDQLAQRQGH